MVTGLGSVPVKVPRSRDRKGHKEEGAIQFTSQLVPPYVRRSKSVEAAIPYLYLKGISSGDFSKVMPILFGKDAVGVSADTVLRLRKQWEREFEHWDQRRLDSKSYVYLWADGVYFAAPLEHDKQCMLVLIGATPEGKKELVGFTDGYRESTQSWYELLLDLKARGLCVPPKLAIGDGAMGFWARYGPAPAINAAGFIKRPTSLIKCQSLSRARPNLTCIKFGWLKVKKTHTLRLIHLLKSIQPSIPKLPTA